jgi:hypothetical protein
MFNAHSGATQQCHHNEVLGRQSSNKSCWEIGWQEKAFQEALALTSPTSDDVEG